jgi:tetratricopeptide (TPR) repeat protein
MTPAHWSKLKALFGEAMELPASERGVFVEKARLTPEAIDHPALIVQLQALIDSHELPGPFLDPVPREFRAEAFSESSAERRIGERIGAWRIVGVLGTGGMGDVFRAVRDDDQYRAEVAIKLMRADVRSTATEQRFKNERQILAGLDHRNIARLLDGGTTDSGTPYVVMELVTGEPVDRFCESRELNVRDRVQLFLQVCAAVSYAHQHLVVHRDLKPNNILVTADGSAKLLDFGIAKLLEADADTAVAEANETVTSLRVMTLEYASPEQVAGGTVTTVSDVYSLGVVLYRLLTGKSPYSPRTNDAQRIAEILSDATPTRPSAVQRKIDRDLDNVLLMALRKEPSRRYGSVEQFANDLRNYLSGMPVQARGNALRYRARKFLWRRKVEIAAGALVACSLLGGLAFSMRETRIAEQQRKLAQKHFDSVRKLANTLLFDLHGEMEKVPGSTKTREMLVKTSLEYLDSLYKEAGTDRSLQQELGVAYKKVGDIQGKQAGSNIGDFQAALRSYARAIGLLEPLVTADPKNRSAAMTLASTYIQQASVMLVAGKPPEALTSVEKGVALTEALKNSFATDSDRYVQLGAAWWAQADILAHLGRTPEMIASLDRLIANSEEFMRLHPNDEQAIKLLSKAYNNAATHTDTRLTEPQQSERIHALLKKSMMASERLVALAPNNVAHRADLAITQHNLARHLSAHGDAATALPLFEVSARVFRAQAEDPNDAQAHYLSALVDSAFAGALFESGRVEEARVILLRCQAILERLQKQSASLRVEYALGQNGVRLGQLYASLAANPKLSAATQIGFWRQAQSSLQQGVRSLQHVTENVALDPLDKVALDTGLAELRRVEAVLAAR